MAQGETNPTGGAQGGQQAGTSSGAENTSGTTGGGAGAGSAASTPQAAGGAGAGNAGNSRSGGGDNDRNIRKTNYRASNRGVIGLGIYLVLLTLLTFYALKVLMTAEEPLSRIVQLGGESQQRTKVQIYCGEDVRDTDEDACESCANQNQNTSTANTDTTNTNTANTTGTNTANTTNTNTNTTNTNTNTANTAATRTNPPGGAGGASNRTGNTNALPTATPRIIRTDIPDLTVPEYLCVKSRVFGGRIVPADGYLFFVIIFAGMLGGLMRGIGSFARHLGLGDFSFQWTWFYLLLPFTGAIVSLAIYLILRGGFYGGGVGKGLALNVFAFAALAILTGLFSENAIEKLRQVAETLLTDVPKKVERENNAREGDKNKKT